jgi:hypothetical protein
MLSLYDPLTLVLLSCHWLYGTDIDIVSTVCGLRGQQNNTSNLNLFAKLHCTNHSLIRIYYQIWKCKSIFMLCNL